MDKNIIEVIQEIYCLLCDMRYPVFVHQLTNWEADRIEDDITAKTFHDYCYRMQLVWCTAEHKDLYLTLDRVTWKLAHFKGI